ncbi:MAG: MmoB/DmpM family protein [Burkholderiales bacterium]|nr:MmoB/DmpM family protein [Burkholderiales bacterium]
MSKVFLALQLSDDSRSIVDALLADNPNAVLEEQPAMVKINGEGRLTLKRASVEERMGRAFDLQELHLSLITLSGNIDETDDEFTLSWGR